MSYQAPLETWTNPLAFCAVVGFTPDAWQRDLLTTTSTRVLVNCSRQTGKSMTCSLAALFRSITRPNHLTLCISPSDRQSGELFKKVLYWVDRLPTRPAITKETARELALRNGSRIVSLPSSAHTIRGFSAVNLLLEDEAAFVDDDLHEAVTPMLAVSQGDMVLMSSPNGKRGHFWKHWEHGGDDWQRLTAKATECTRFDPAFLAAERRAKGDAIFRQEYLCEFLNAASGLVYHRFADQCVVQTAPNLDEYVIGIDYGYKDDTAWCVLGWRHNDPRVYVVECWKEAGVIPSKAAAIVHDLERKYHAHAIVGDVGGLGKGYAEEARQRFSLPITPAEKHNKTGNISLLNDALERRELLLVGPATRQLQEEWGALVWHDTIAGKENPTQPNHCADACLYAWRAARAFHEVPLTAGPAYGTQEFWQAEEAKMRDARDEQVRRQLREQKEAEEEGFSAWD